MQWPVFVLPGIEILQYYGDNSIIRNGTFLEGNYSGLFYLISALLACKTGRYLPALILFGGVVSSFSSTSIFLLFPIVLLICWYEFRHHRFMVHCTFLLNVVILSSVVILLLAQTPYGRSMVVKLVSQDKGIDVNDATFSRDNRIDTALTALRLFGDHPFIGVGLAQFNNYYKNNSISPPKYWEVDRVIPNNVYAEILGETGLIGALPFFFCVGMVCFRVWQARDFYLLLCLGAILLGWNSFPSFSIMYVWAFFGGALGYLDSRPVWQSRSVPELPATSSLVLSGQRSSRQRAQAYVSRRRGWSGWPQRLWPSLRMGGLIGLLFLLGGAVGWGVWTYQADATGESGPPPSDFILGVNGKSPEQEIYHSISAEAQMELLKKLGIDWYRISWSDQTTPEQMDHLCETAKAARINLLGVLVNRVDLSIDRPDSEYEEDAEQFARKWSHRYSAQIKVWELQNELDDEALQKRGDTDPSTGQMWNVGEPDGSKIAHYEPHRLGRALAILRGLSRGVSEGAPSGLRLIGTAGWKHYGFLEAVEQASIPYDLISWHWYSEMGTMPNAEGTNVLRKLKKYHRDIWLTEANRRNGSMSNQETAEAEYLAKDFWRTVQYYPQVKAYFVYELLDEPPLSNGDGEANYGLLKVAPDGAGGWKVSETKPAFSVLQRAATWLHPK